MNYMPFVWLGLGVVLVVIELLGAYEFTLWLAIDAFIVCIAAFAGASVLSQIILAVALGLALNLLSRRLSFFSLNPLKETHSLRVNKDEVIGKHGVVVIGVPASTEEAKDGLVVLDGTKWVARSGNGERICQGTEVEVTSLVGLKVKVTPLQGA